MDTAAHDADLQWYMRRIADAPLLTAGQEEFLAAHAGRDGEPRARRKMIAANLPLVVHIAREHAGAGASLVDVIGEGSFPAQSGPVCCS